MGLLRSALATDTMAKAPAITASLARIAQRTAEINAAPRHARGPAAARANADVSVAACLELLQLAAFGCTHDGAALRRFWQAVSFDFVFMLLDPRQRARDILLTLDLFGTSALRDSLGPVARDGSGGSGSAPRAVRDKIILDRISAFLLPPVAAAAITGDDDDDDDEGGSGAGGGSGGGGGGTNSDGRGVGAGARAGARTGAGVGAGAGAGAGLLAPAAVVAATAAAGMSSNPVFSGGVPGRTTPLTPADLRIAVLNLLGTICCTQHGGEAMAKHDHVIGRLVRLMDDELDALYNFQQGHKKW